MHTAHQTQPTPSMRLKGSLIPMTVLELAHYDIEKLDEEISEKIAQAPSFFNGLPIVISLEKLQEEDSHPVKFSELVECCRRNGMIPVAVRGGTTAQKSQAEAAGLAIIPAQKIKAPELEEKEILEPRPDTIKGPIPAETGQDTASETEIRDTEQAETILVAPRGAETEVASGNSTNPVGTGETSEDQVNAEQHEPQVQETKVIAVPQQTKMVYTPVRSGQQIYAKDGDLIVLAAVSPGAEILADGNIHVYGPLRGRALAGINGNTKARIFCQSLEAELVSIAGQYKISEDLQQQSGWRSGVQIALDDDKLAVKKL